LGVLQGQTKDESLRNFPHFFDANNRFIQSSDIPKAESLEDFLERTKRAVSNIQDLSKIKNILVVTHDGTLNAFLAHVKGIGLNEVQKLYRFEHGEPVKLL
jgi:broad specificity phosphatase PhoE